MNATLSALRSEKCDARAHFTACAHRANARASVKLIFVSGRSRSVGVATPSALARGVVAKEEGESASERDLPLKEASRNNCLPLIRPLRRAAGKMASEDRLVTFKLQSGEVFDDIVVDNLELTLAEFIDHNLKTLEVGSRVRLAVHPHRYRRVMAVAVPERVGM